MEASALTPTRTLPGLPGPSALLRLQSDERLVALTRRGQHAAFETLCARYQARLLSFCRHMLGSREDAEDVLQEVFAAAFNAILADERDINVRPWLYRIARNRSLNHLRRASAIGVDSMDVHFADQGQSTSEKVIRKESFRQLLSDVQQLPETQRTALLMREIDALSYEQIAHAMETTVPSVKSLLVRARISLAEAAESRKLSCAEVRLELGETAEGLIKLSAPARRHVRGCERCRDFRKHLKHNNQALAAMLPVAPLLLAKKLLLTKLGSTASAGSAHVAGSAGATMGAGVGAGAGAGAAATGGTSVAGGLLTAGTGALATKAVAGLAAAAIVTAGAVAADHVAQPHRHFAPAVSASAQHYSSAPVVVSERPQPLSAAAQSSAAAAAGKLAKAAAGAQSSAAAGAATARSSTLKTDPAAGLTEVSSETTQLPAATGQATVTDAEPTPVSTSPGPQAPSAPAAAETAPAPLQHSGASGESGASGASGPSGATGPSAPSGATGPSGASGSSGASGPALAPTPSGAGGEAQGAAAQALAVAVAATR